MAYEIIIGRDEDARKKYGLQGTVFLGKQYVQMGPVTSLSSGVYLDVASSHVVFICGKRGGGKCLDGDTLITLNDGSLVPIKNLENDDREIMALQKDLKVAPAVKEGFYKRMVSRMLRLQLRTGKEIKLTPEHPLLTIEGWKPAEALSIGSRIATPRKLEIFGEESMAEAEVKLLAYLLAEGHLSNRFVLFSNMDGHIVNDFTEAVRAFDPALVVKEHSKPGCFRIMNPTRKRKTDMAVRDAAGRFVQGSAFDTKTSIRKWLGQIGIYGKKSPDKFIPDAIFKLPRAKLALFLNRLFSCDGSIYRSHAHSWGISYASASKRMIMEVQHLLLRFGIVGRYREKRWKRFVNYELELDGENISLFLQHIGFFGKKEERQRIALKEAATAKRNPNLDTVPKELWNIYRPENWTAVGRELGYATPKAARSSVGYAPSRQKLLQIARADGSEALELLAISDIYWDEVVAIEELTGEFTVYDITVPEHHNFVANDIIVHNSYTMGAIAEGLADLPQEVRQNLSFILLDTMGIYWTMKYPNKQDELLLAEWGFKPKGLDVKIYTPAMYHQAYKDKGIPTDFPFSLNPSELDAADWQMTFDISPNEPMGVLIERVVYQLRKTKKQYNINDVIQAIHADTRTEQSVRDACENRFLSTEAWGVFAEHGEGTQITDLARAGQVSVLDVSCYATLPNGWKIKHVIVGLIAEKLFIQRMIVRKAEEYASIHEAIHYFSEEKKEEKLEMPLVWLVLDEAHEFLPRDGKNPATDPLVTIMREGRQPGISLILATQQPGKIHTDVMTQADTVLSHRITAKIDVDALGMLMQSYMREGLNVQIDNLPRKKGSAVLFDDTNERLYMIQVRPRFTWHGGSSPVALHEKEKKI